MIFFFLVIKLHLGSRSYSLTPPPPPQAPLTRCFAHSTATREGTPRWPCSARGGCWKASTKVCRACAWTSAGRSLSPRTWATEAPAQVNRTYKLIWKHAFLKSKALFFFGGGHVFEDMFGLQLTQLPNQKKKKGTSKEYSVWGHILAAAF